MRRTLMVVYGVVASFIIFAGSAFAADNEVKIFSWEGYVTNQDVEAVNKILKDSKKYKGYSVKLLDTFAEGPEQMFTVLKSGKADVSFLTLNYIKMQKGKTAKLLQPINISSPRMPNYKLLLKSLKDIPMGLKGGKPLYVPWGGGAYGIWADMKQLKPSELPKSVKDLWLPEWKGKLSLTKGQVQPNLAIVMLSLGKPPFYLNDIANKRKLLKAAGNPEGEIQKKTDGLYKQVGHFWGGGPEFKKGLTLMASYGIAVSAENAKGGKWKLINFKEGNTVWLDTINFHKQLKGKKLEVAEIFLNYFIGEKVQTRVVKGLGMVAASSLVKDNTLINENPNFFSQKMFWPPYTAKADNIINKISGNAMKSSGK